MNEINLENIRAAMFTDPGVKAVDDLRLVAANEHDPAIAATITVAAPSVDLDLVHAVIAQVLADQFGIHQVVLCFNDPGPVPPPPTGAALRKM
jgi:Co/Zn/Cd efflux system component